VPGENHRPVTSHWQTLLHNAVSKLILSWLCTGLFWLLEKGYRKSVLIFISLLKKIIYLYYSWKNSSSTILLNYFVTSYNVFKTDKKSLTRYPVWALSSVCLSKLLISYWDRHGRDHMVAGFTTTCAISAYHH
jgi:hypothetical protein